MKRFLWGFVLLFMLLTACTTSATSSELDPPLKAIALDNSVKIISGQTVYVPIYSQIYTWERQHTMNLTATLSIRNIDLDHPMILSSVQYYNNRGQTIRAYLEQPVELGPLSSTSFVVNQEDTSGGIGAAFVVEWMAQTELAAPVIEAIMINAGSNQGVSFVSPGRVIKNRT